MARFILNAVVLEPHDKLVSGLRTRENSVGIDDLRRHATIRMRRQLGLERGLRSLPDSWTDCSPLAYRDGHALPGCVSGIAIGIGVLLAFA
jgi:hypothetical protein